MCFLLLNAFLSLSYFITYYYFYMFCYAILMSSRNCETRCLWLHCVSFNFIFFKLKNGTEKHCLFLNANVKFTEIFCCSIYKLLQKRGNNKEMHYSFSLYSLALIQTFSLNYHYSSFLPFSFFCWLAMNDRICKI